MNPEFGSERRLSDPELIQQVTSLARTEHGVAACLMAHLVEMEKRQLHLSQGCRSLYTYCIEILHFSEWEAHLRQEVARECRKYPRILELLRAGDLHLTSVKLLIPVLTPENHCELLEAARRKTKRELQDLIALRRARETPNPPPTDDLFGPSAAGARESEINGCSNSGMNEPGAVDSSQGLNSECAGRSAERSDAETPSQARIVPLSSGGCRITFTASPAAYERLRNLQNLLSHPIPDGDAAKIIDRALSLLLRETEKKKNAATDKPRKARPIRSGSRHIPAAVKRAVLARDGARCAFVGENGHRCTERRFLQYHHVDPHGLGGPPTVRNIEIRCQGHNNYESDLVYRPHVADCEPGPEDLGPQAFGSHPGEPEREAG